MIKQEKIKEAIKNLKIDLPIDINKINKHYKDENNILNTLRPKSQKEKDEIDSKRELLEKSFEYLKEAVQNNYDFSNPIEKDHDINYYSEVNDSVKTLLSEFENRIEQRKYNEAITYFYSLRKHLEKNKNLKKEPFEIFEREEFQSKLEIAQSNFLDSFFNDLNTLIKKESFEESQIILNQLKKTIESNENKSKLYKKLCKDFDIKFKQINDLILEYKLNSQKQNDVKNINPDESKIFSNIEPKQDSKKIEEAQKNDYTDINYNYLKSMITSTIEETNLLLNSNKSDKFNEAISLIRKLENFIYNNQDNNLKISFSKNNLSDLLLKQKEIIINSEDDLKRKEYELGFNQEELYKKDNLPLFFNQALEHYNKYINYFPEDAIGYIALSRLYMEKYDSEDLIKAENYLKLASTKKIISKEQEYALNYHFSLLFEWKYDLDDSQKLDKKRTIAPLNYLKESLDYIKKILEDIELNNKDFDKSKYGEYSNQERNIEDKLFRFMSSIYTQVVLRIKTFLQDKNFKDAKIALQRYIENYVNHSTYTKTLLTNYSPTGIKSIDNLENEINESEINYIVLLFNQIIFEVEKLYNENSFAESTNKINNINSLIFNNSFRSNYSSIDQIHLNSIDLLSQIKDQKYIIQFKETLFFIETNIKENNFNNIKKLEDINNLCLINMTKNNYDKYIKSDFDIYVSKINNEKESKVKQDINSKFLEIDNLLIKNLFDIAKKELELFDISMKHLYETLYDFKFKDIVKNKLEEVIKKRNSFEIIKNCDEKINISNKYFDKISNESSKEYLITMISNFKDNILNIKNNPDLHNEDTIKKLDNILSSFDKSFGNKVLEFNDSTFDQIKKEYKDNLNIKINEIIKRNHKIFFMKRYENLKEINIAFNFNINEYNKNIPNEIFPILSLTGTTSILKRIENTIDNIEIKSSFDINEVNNKINTLLNDKNIKLNNVFKSKIVNTNSIIDIFSEYEKILKSENIKNNEFYNKISKKHDYLEFNNNINSKSDIENYIKDLKNKTKTSEEIFRYEFFIKLERFWEQINSIKPKEFSNQKAILIYSTNNSEFNSNINILVIPKIKGAFFNAEYFILYNPLSLIDKNNCAITEYIDTVLNNSYSEVRKIFEKEIENSYPFLIDNINNDIELIKFEKEDLEERKNQIIENYLNSCKNTSLFLNSFDKDIMDYTNILTNKVINVAFQNIIDKIIIESQEEITDLF